MILDKRNTSEHGQYMTNMNNKPRAVTATIHRTHCSYGHSVSCTYIPNQKLPNQHVNWFSSIHEEQGWPMVAHMAALDLLAKITNATLDWKLERTARKCRVIECDHCHGAK